MTVFKSARAWHMETVQPLPGFRQFTKDEAVAIMDAKTSKMSEVLERELRTMQEEMQRSVREIIREQMQMLMHQVEKNTDDIRTLMNKPEPGSATELKAAVEKNAENIKLLDRNVKTLDANVRAMATSH